MLKKKEENQGPKMSYNYNKRLSTFSQVIAVVIGNIIMLQFGMSIAMSTVINGELMKISSNCTQQLTLTPSQSSWYGSLLLIFHPVGSLLSSFVQDKFGRKICFVLVSLPEFVGWLSLYIANSPAYLYVSSSCLGFAMGLSEAPILTYIGECVEPRIRSGLASFTVFCSMIGLSATFNIASFYSWRQIAFVYAFLPAIVCIMTFAIVPESPIWLLSRNRVREATKSLCWLRGFTSLNAVTDELNYMIEFTEPKVKKVDVLLLESKLKNIDESTKRNLPNSISRNLFNGVWGPFVMCNMIFIFCTVSSMTPAKPYLRNIMNDVGLQGLPFDTKLALAIIGTAGTLFGTFLNMITIKFIRKRTTLICSTFISLLCQFLLGLYAMGNLKSICTNSWLPFSLFYLISFVSGYGITPIPWILLGEVFSMKSRGILSGVTAALNSIFAFCLTNMYWDVVGTLTLPWTLIIYSIVGAFGLPYIYYKLPETENKTLQQIQDDFERS